MKKESFSFLKRLIEAPSPSGFEQNAQKVIKTELGAFSDEVKTDIHGNVIGIKNSQGRPRIMIAGHCDEVGLMVKYIDDDGFISFSSIGGLDAHIIPGQRVKIHTEDGPILGVVGKKPIHVLEKKERSKVVQIHEQWIDVGASSKKDIEKTVRVGDPITFAPGLEKLKENVLVARGFDDKIGAFIACEVLRSLSGNSFAPSVFVTSTVQEEIGLRGARTSAFTIKPDIGIVVEVDAASDFPGMDKRKTGEIKVGKGPVLFKGPNINPKLGNMLIKLAERENIPHQISGESRATPTDANVIQISRSGVATALVSIATRYLHTPIEVLSLEDVENAIKLLKSFILQLREDEDFIPTSI